MQRVLAMLLAVGVWGCSATAADQWVWLSTIYNHLLPPSGTVPQTMAVVGDLNQDGVNDFIIGTAKGIPSIVGYLRITNNWVRFPIENAALGIETGAALVDIDGDGDLDLVASSNAGGTEIWWWENPGRFAPQGAGWTRHLIKQGGRPGQRGLIFGDFKGTGKPQLAFWSQGAGALYLAEIPDHPRTSPSWQYVEIMNLASLPVPRSNLGLAAADIDGDGKLDIVAGNHWLKHDSENVFKAIRFAPAGGLVEVGRFQPGSTAQIIVAQPDGTVPLRMYAPKGDPLKSESWLGRNLTGPLARVNTLQIMDANRDGFADIFVTETAKLNLNRPVLDNPNAHAWFLYGNGHGGFKQSEFLTGFDLHDAQVADLDGDGDLDVLGKPLYWGAPRIDIWLQHGTAGVVASAGRKLTAPVSVSLGYLGQALATNSTELLAQAGRVDLRTAILPYPLFDRAAAVKTKLESRQLKALALLVALPELRRTNSTLLVDTKLLGVNTLIAFSPALGTNETTPQAIQNLVGELNRLTVQLAPHRITLLYQLPAGLLEKSKTAALQLFALRSRSAGIRFVIDPVAAGFMTDELLREFRGRVEMLLIHEAASEDSPPSLLGKGRVNWQGLIQLALETGVAEFALTPGTPADLSQLPGNTYFLRELRF